MTTRSHRRVHVFVATLVMVVGVGTVALLSHRAGYRLGGVMVLPLLAVYTFREPLSPLVFVVGTAAAWGALWTVREYTLTHGRRVFLVAVLAGVCATILAAYVLAVHTPVGLPFDDAEVVASIFPGVAAYNLMRLDPEDRAADVGLMVAVFAGLLCLGAGGLVVVAGWSLPTPPVLALPTTDLVGWLGVAPRGDPFPRITPNRLSVALLVADVLVYESVRSRYDVRLAGIVVLPLLAVFSVHLEYAPHLFAVGATAVFVLLTVVHWLTLLYGRVLLALGLVAGSGYALALGLVLGSDAPGLTLFFLGLFVGVAAYTLHRVSPRHRAAQVRLSAGLFTVFYGVLALLVEIPPGGLSVGDDPLYLLLGAAAVGLAARELVRLERSRPPLSDFAAASVFAAVDVDGADAATSPLVDGSERAREGDADGGLRFDADPPAESNAAADVDAPDESARSTGGE